MRPGETGAFTNDVAPSAAAADAAASAGLEVDGVHEDVLNELDDVDAIDETVNHEEDIDVVARK